MTSQGFCLTLCDEKLHVTPGLFAEQSKHAKEQRGLMEEFATQIGGGGWQRSPQDSRCKRKEALGGSRLLPEKKSLQARKAGVSSGLGTGSAKGSLTLWLWTRVRGLTVWTESRSLG